MLAIVMAVPLALLSAVVNRGVTTPAGDVAIRGADISFTPQMEAIGTTYRTPDGVEQPLESILAGEGATHVRLRVWVDPPPGYSDLASALAMARRAHAAGLEVLLVPHYSDTWADDTQQRVPAAWAGQDLETLTTTVEHYTRDVVAAFADQGTPVDMVQLGNEVTLGLLWPAGRVFADSSQEDWSDVGVLLRAGARGARAGAPDKHPVRLVLHINRGGDLGAATWFFDNAVAQDIPFDVIGLSYYPRYSGPLSNLEEVMHGLASRYETDVLVVETAYPWTLEQDDALDGDSGEVTSVDQLPEEDAYPPTPGGQAAFFEALRTVVAGVPDGRGAGFLVWEPGWLPGVGWRPGAGNQYGNMTWFDPQGDPLPVLRALRGRAEE